MRISGQGLDSSWIAIDKEPFFWFLVWQSSFAFFLAAFIGPTLVAPDLAHNALSLYLSRPLSRADYIVGKLLVLLVPLSAVTWIPGLLLLGLQTSLAGTGWLSAHWRLVPAVVVGSWIWILLLAVLAIAISAWVKWRPVATGMLFGIFVVGEAFGKAIEEIAGFRWGKVLAMDDVVQTIWADLFGGIDFLGHPFPRDPLPVAACWATLGGSSSPARCGCCIARCGPARCRDERRTDRSDRRQGAAAASVLFEDVSKFYGEILGVNRVDLAIGPGITSLVGPNGSGKTTLMNLATGLLLPTEGAVSVLGISPADPERPVPHGRLLHAVRHLSARHHRLGFRAPLSRAPRPRTRAGRPSSPARDRARRHVRRRLRGGSPATARG